jgi:hypothetical protein
MQPRKKSQPVKKARAAKRPAIKQPDTPQYKLKSTVGRKLLFSDPQLFMQACYEYFQWCEKNPVWSIEYLGKDAVKKDVPKMRMFTLSGLMLYLDASESWLRSFRKRLAEKTIEGLTEDQYEEFDLAIERAQQIIKTQKLEGAASGLLQSNFVAREMGLWDNTRVELEGEIKQQHTVTGPLEIMFVNSGPPPVDKESEIDLTR